MSSSATVRVEKATSDLLMGPDWTMNMDICDSINSHHWQAKDVVKAVKKRLQNKSPKTQLLSLTLLETMIKNCGDYVHFQIAERNILQEMIKIVRKKADMQVRDKILVLLDSWQEAFGGPGGKYPQYYWAYEELRRTGVEFPQRSRDAAPIFTPPVTSSMLRHSQPGFGMPSNTSIRLDEAMASEMETLSLSNLDSMRSVMELLADMLQAMNPNDHEAVKDEVIVDLVSRCRSNQKKLIQMLNSTGDEELLGQGLMLNDNLQSLLAKHDAIASGSPLPTEAKDLATRPMEFNDSSARPSEVSDASLKSSAISTTSIAVVTSNQLEEDEDEDDDFAQLARRSTKNRALPSGSTSTGIAEGAGGSIIVPQAAAASISNPNNALALPNPPSQVRTTTKEQDIIDLLSITLSTTSTSPHTPQTPPPISNQSMHQASVSPTTQGYTYSQPYHGSQGQVPYSNYIAPWAQPRSPPESQPQFQPQPQPEPQPQPQPHPQHQPQPQPQPRPQSHPQPKLQQPFETQTRLQPQYPQSSFNYPPPPWATVPANPNQNPISAAAPYPFPAPGASASVSQMPMHSTRTLQNYNSFPARANNGSSRYAEPQMNSVQRPASSFAGQKPFVPSYRLFEDLNVLGKPDGGLKATSSTSTSFQGMSGQSMVGGRK